MTVLVQATRASALAFPRATFGGKAVRWQVTLTFEPAGVNVTDVVLTPARAGAAVEWAEALAGAAMANVAAMPAAAMPVNRRFVLKFVHTS